MILDRSALIRFLCLYFYLSRLITCSRKGAGGGPTEDNVTGLLVRSTASNWSKGSLLAVDAGIHLAAIIKILEEHLPNAIPRTPPRLPLLGHNRARSKSIGNNGVPAGVASHGSIATAVASPIGLPDGAKSTLELTTGPFASLEVPFESARANAAHILRYLIPTYLISHPHLDHVSGFAVNTASFQQTSFPKRLAALPSTVEAIKDHIFNDVIWPNLSDEDGGVGLVTYMRLQEGGNVALGVGEGQGYIEICDGLTVKCWSISHGTCMRRHHHRGSHADTSGHNSSAPGRASRHETPPTLDRNYSLPNDRICVSDSTAFFLRDDHTGREVLIFGDVEPDSISLTPRTKQVWTEAAPKIAAGTLQGILIECSYDDSQPDKALFGHLNPRHLIAELQVLATEVANVKYGEEVLDKASSGRKRKRQSNGFKFSQEDTITQPFRGRAHSHATRRRKRGSSVSPATKPANDEFLPMFPNEAEAAGIEGAAEPMADEGVVASRKSSRTTGVLNGVRVIVIHVKDNLKDGPNVGDTILGQLEAYEKDAQLGCGFEISKAGTSVWL